jgi:hypothetical protein
MRSNYDIQRQKKVFDLFVSVACFCESNIRLLFTLFKEVSSSLIEDKKFTLLATIKPATHKALSAVK